MSRDTIRQQFGSQAESYVTSEVHAKGRSLARMVEKIKSKPDWCVLDIATGAGHTALAFAPFVNHVLATDITTQMLEQAQRLVRERNLENISIEIADAEDLPYDDDFFDLVTCRIAPHHFDDIPQFLRESMRVLRPGGWLGLVDNIVPSGSTGDYVNALERLRDPSHGRCLSIEEWMNELRSAGYHLQKPEIMIKTLNFSFWTKRHGPAMRSFLLAMLTEATGETAAFLQPDFTGRDTTFKLAEGIFIGQKPS